MRKSKFTSTRTVAYTLMLAFSVVAFKPFMAAASSEDADVDEVYVNDSIASNPGDDDDQVAKIDVRLTRPGEAENRLADDGYALVPGAEKLIFNQQNVIESENTGRAIASLPSTSLEKPVIRRTSAASGAVGATVEPQPMTAVKPIRISEISERAPSENEKPKPVDSFAFANSEVTRFEPKAVSAGIYQEVSVIVSDQGYFPSRVFVTQNIPVRMYLSSASKGTLCFIIDSWGVKKGVVPGKVEEINFVPEQAGNYRFYCPVKGIEGSLTVRESNKVELSGRNTASSTVANVASAPKKLKELTDDEE